MRRLSLFLALLPALFLAAAAARAQEVPHIVQLNVEKDSGLVMDKSYVLAHVAVKAGDLYDRVATGRDVATLLKTGRFSDVRAVVEQVPDGVILTYRIRPKPKLGTAIAVTNASAIKVSKIVSEMDLQPGDWIDENALGPKVKAVEELYRREGYADVAVKAALTVDTNTGFCAVALDVREGEPRRLKKVVFVGNEHVGGNTVRTLVNLPKSWNPWYWFRKPNYDPVDMKRRVEDLRSYYRDLGYLHAQVFPPQTNSVSYGRLRLTLTIDEGPLFKVGKVSVRGARLLPLKDVEKQVVLKPGDVAAMTAIRGAAKAIRDFYGSKGHIRTAVDWVLTPTAEPGVMDVQFEIREGQLTMVGDVVIRGNVATREKVIRREINVYPGEIFNEVKVDQTERRLMNLNYFENVTGYPAPTGIAGTNDLIVDVLEKPTGLFTVGAGFSSVDSLMGYTEITQGNFDLLGWPSFTGGGQRLKLSLRAGTKMNEYSLSLEEPWFLDRPLSLSGEIYTMSRSYSEYDITRTGGSPALKFPVPLGARLELRYRLEHISVSDVEDTEVYTDVDGSEFVYTEDDSHTDSSFSMLLSKDRRDNPMLPTRGYRVSLGGVLTGGPMGFDTDMYSLALKAEQHVPLWFRHVLSLRGSAEVEDAYGRERDGSSIQQVPLSERYFMGGPRTVRGIKYRDAGPKATRTIPNPDGTTYTEFEPRGGQTMMLAGAEYTIPVGVPHIRLAMFFDIGSLAVDPYDFSCEEYAWGTGLGIRLDIPGFPIRLDYAFDTGVGTDRKLDETRTDRWSFWIGYGF